GAGTDPQARATSPGERAPDGAAHECVDGSVTRAEAPVKLDQAFARIGLPEKGIKTRLEIQVARCGLPAMHGLHDASMRLSLNGHRRPAPWRQCPALPGGASCPDGLAARAPHAPPSRIRESLRGDSRVLRRRAANGPGSDSAGRFVCPAHPGSVE